jgi:DNA-binding beta-propeller fold protein YncE
VDPEGSVSIVDLSAGAGELRSDHVTNVDFRAFNEAALDPSVRVFGPGASAAQDFEPEYITVTSDSKTAYVTLQENNAIAVVDIAAGKATRVMGLGFKDHSVAGNGLDASDKDAAIRIQSWPVKGMYQPDSIACFTSGDMRYLITANEGDHRDYGGFCERFRVGDATIALDGNVFDDADSLKAKTNLGRLYVTKTLGDADADGVCEDLYAFGTRSFSIWTEAGRLVFDSGDQLERITAERLSAQFNSDHTKNGSFDNRSDNRGPEPEGIALGLLGGRLYAFIGLERVGGIMVYDISFPQAPRFVTYVNNRNFSGDPAAGTAGDLGPEGLAFIPASDSPNGKPLLAVGNEVSGTVTIFQIETR